MQFCNMMISQSSFLLVGLKSLGVFSSGVKLFNSILLSVASKLLWLLADSNECLSHGDKRFAQSNVYCFCYTKSVMGFFCADCMHVICKYSNQNSFTISFRRNSSWRCNSLKFAFKAPENFLSLQKGLGGGGVGGRKNLA